METAPPCSPEGPGTPRPHLRGLTPEQLLRSLPDLHISPGIARRVANRILSENRDDLDGVPGLSKALTRALLQRCRIDRLRVADRRASRLDPFVKYLFAAADGAYFEAVRIPLERPRWSVCVSSQAGCLVGCAFCATGRAGFTRNLEPWEMVEQVLTIRAEARERPVTGVVFQGQGEPLLNYEAVMQAADVLRHPCGLRVGSDRISISTVGFPAAIERYTDDGHRYRLILSLTSAFDDRRVDLIPAARAHRVGDLAPAMRRHARARGGPVHLAWVLIAGLNTGPEEAAELARLFPDVPLRVSVIDVVDATGRYQPPAENERRSFLDALARRRIGFIRRYSGGVDIQAACGTLASSRCGGFVLPAAQTQGPHSVASAANPRAGDPPGLPPA
jgi:23S rRNA (adenine2503-C2)-methyltransferase